MLIDGEASAENHQRFVDRASQNEVVFCLSNEGGVANSPSNDDSSITVLPFWSNEAYARRAASAFEATYNVESISLFDFLYRWLPGMTSDGVLAGVNWDGNLCGDEVDPFELREDLEQAMTNQARDGYAQRYVELTRDS